MTLDIFYFYLLVSLFFLFCIDPAERLITEYLSSVHIWNLKLIYTLLCVWNMCERAAAGDYLEKQTIYSLSKNVMGSGK